MKGMEILGAAAVIILLSAVWVCVTHMRMRRIMEHMSRMLDEAADGSFREKVYDESLLSSVEAKLADYLLASEVSARNLSEEKEKVKQLIADISHQTKIPVANLLLYAQMLEERELPQEERAFVQEISRQADKLNFLIVSLVKASRLETGVFVLHPKWDFVAPLIREVIKETGPKAEKKNLSVKFASKELMAYFDWKWTAEAVSNIVDNAVKYTPKGGSIMIELLNTNLFVRIEVRDTGIGIPESETAKIFQRFYRGTSVSEQEGAGIGLYLARQIITGENGYMRVRSAPGEGTSFFVYLPSGSAYNKESGCQKDGCKDDSIDKNYKRKGDGR